MKYVFNMVFVICNMLLVNCTDYVRIIGQVRNIIAIFMTLDHVHFENEILFILFKLPTVACRCSQPTTVAGCPYLISTT